MTKREFLDTVFALAPNEANAIMDAFDEYVDSNKKIDCDAMDKCEKLQLPPVNCSEFPNSSDTISRQQAIEALDKRFDSIPMEQTSEILMLRKDLRNLPPAQPKTGKWALQSDDYHEYYECDQCGMAVGLDDVRNFCPNCGADMRGEQDG